MIFDPWYWVVIGMGFALSAWAAWRVKRTFARYAEEPTRSGLTGADIARSILREEGIEDVAVEPVEGRLSDHYDPSTKTLRLSEPVYAGRSMAAFGVAAHEVGHAIQDFRGYGPLRLRSAWVPVANFGGGASTFAILAAVFLGGTATALGGALAWVGIAMLATTTLFTLVTLPVEFDASRRAIAILERGGYVTEQELGGARRVLNAAALTYVAAFVTSILTLAYWAWALGLFGGRSSE